MGEVKAVIAGKILTLLGYDGTDFQNVVVDANGQIITSPQSPSRMIYEGDHFIRRREQKSIPNNEWIVTAPGTVGPNKIWYVTGFGIASVEGSKQAVARMYVNDDRIATIQVNDISTAIFGTCLGKAPAGGLVYLFVYQNTGAAVNFDNWWTGIEIDA